MSRCGRDAKKAGTRSRSVSPWDSARTLRYRSQHDKNYTFKTSSENIDIYSVVVVIFKCFSIAIRLRIVNKSFKDTIYRVSTI